MVFLNLWAKLHFFNSQFSNQYQSRAKLGKAHSTSRRQDLRRPFSEKKKPPMKGNATTLIAACSPLHSGRSSLKQRKDRAKRRRVRKVGASDGVLPKRAEQGQLPEHARLHLSDLQRH